MCSVQCAVCSVQCAVLSMQCAVSSVQCAVCSVRYAVCCVQFDRRNDGDVRYIADMVDGQWFLASPPVFLYKPEVFSDSS